MITKTMWLLLVVQLVSLLSCGNCFQDPSFRRVSTPPPSSSTSIHRLTLSAAVHPDENMPHRRAFLQTAALITTTLVSSTSVANAAEEGDLTSQMFNEDGSLKEGIESQAKFRTINMSIDPTAERVVCVDGSSPQSGAVQISYELPLKWEVGDNLYFDRSEGVNAKACNHIYVYQAPGKVAISQLEKATRIGIAKALDIIDELAQVNDADLIGGRVTNVDGQKYFQFDLGVAPKTCADSPDNLGLGFCPFESLFLLSGTVLDEKLYVFALQCNKDEWKRANADLRRVRSSFSVASA